jgi:hypothetical protein
MVDMINFRPLKTVKTSNQNKGHHFQNNEQYGNMVPDQKAQQALHNL